VLAGLLLAGTGLEKSRGAAPFVGAKGEKGTTC